MIIKIFKKIMIVTFLVVILLFFFVFFYMKQAKFGKLPSGKRLEIIQKSPNYKDNKFQNLNPTPSLSKGISNTRVLYDFFFKKTENKIPSERIPSDKTDLKTLDINENILVWFGHSSCYFHLNGKRFLVDPIFSGKISPISNSSKAFEGSDVYVVDDFPEIDYLLITHDHYDHLDYETIVALKSKIKIVICALGVGEHFEYWNYNPTKIIEKDWYDSVELENQVKITLTPARHFSGRTLKRNVSLWTSFVVESTDYKMFIGGDSGYGSHFKEIGNKFGPFDLAILECGQYNEKWRYIHTMPEEIHIIATELQAKRFLPVHNSKFALAHHKWKEPLERVLEHNKAHEIAMITPKIGELVKLNDPTQMFSKWWENVE